MRLLDVQWTATPFYGIRRMTACLRRKGYAVNHKRVERLMARMGLQGIFPQRKLSRSGAESKIYPYLLSGVIVTRTDEVWSADVTYIRLRNGYLYLVAVMDWFSRYVLSWRLSNTLDAGFCVEALEEALGKGCPSIFNTDQGVQFTSADFTGKLSSLGIQISMDGRGRALDNIFVERLWRSVKYEDVYLKDYSSGLEAYQGLACYFKFYNETRLHQSLDYRTPVEVYGSCQS
jgi:putative transposase